MEDQLSVLLDNPEERLHVELKSWYEFSDKTHRADFARHIAAISNHGGGYIIFGFKDDGTPISSIPPSFSLNHDIVASITRKYLDPSVDCQVRKLASSLGNQHYIVIVPPHGTTPICAKADGPHLNGKPQGICAGVHYIRKSGPESSPISSSMEWANLIRRCALNDRQAVMAAISRIVSETNFGGTSKRDPSLLKNWAEAANNAYLKTINGTNFKVPIKDCRMQFSYMIYKSTNEPLPQKNFRNILREVCFGVDSNLQSGWSMFYVFDNEDMSPKPYSEEIQGLGDIEFLQTNLVKPNRDFGFDFWRISAVGIATLIREYWEDVRIHSNKPRTVLNPHYLTKMLYELVEHAYIFSQKFEDSEEIEFRCEWVGLKGRRLISDYNPLFHFSGQVSNMDKIITTGRWPIAKLPSEKGNVVEALGARVFRAFDWYDFTVPWIEREIARKQ